MTMTVVNPATGEEAARFEEHTDGEVSARLATSWDAFAQWRTTSFVERASLLREVATALEKNSDDLAKLMAQEMGKPIGAGRSEVEKCAWVCRYEADNGEERLTPFEVETDASKSGVRFDPLGPVLAVMPWNFPLWQVFRFAAPAVMAGNVGLLKHASNVPGCALAIEQLFAEAGAPQGVFTTLLIDSSRASDVIADDRIRAVTLTGSVPAGRTVAAEAGKHLKKTVMELGGSDPFIVLDDADVARAAEVGASSRLINSGQSCIAAKRFIVVEDVADEFIEAFVTQVESSTVGDPLDEETDVGPMARDDLRDDLHDQVRRTVSAGATLLTGGEPIDGPGFFYAPTVLTDVPTSSAAASEETFGPAAAVLRASDEAEAIEIANASDFGLGASLWTEDLDRAERLLPRIEAGNLFVNGLVKSDPRLPFGGVKDSGYGRELGGFGIREFVNVKTYWMA